MSHTTNCEHSKSKRCRCDCDGIRHGTASTAETGTVTDERPPGLLYPELADDLKRAGQQVARYREEMQRGEEAAKEMQLG
jgi:hypothetical protein